jgi:hypothetical protein
MRYTLLSAGDGVSYTLRGSEVAGMAWDDWGRFVMRLKVTSRRASFRRTGGQCLIVAAMFGASLTVLTAPGRAATTLLVPEDFSTISAAIAAAAPGDTVSIAAGTYTGAVTLNKPITLRGRSPGSTPTSNTTTLEASASVDVITIPSGVSPAPTVTGLVLRSGLSGISLKSPATIVGNLFVANNDQLDYKVEGGGTARGNVFQDALDDGIDVNHPVRDLLIENNQMISSDGDGVEMRLNDDTIFGTAHIIFRGNEIWGSRSDGIQIIDYFTDTNRVIAIERNLIRDNGRAGIGLLDGGTTAEDFRAASIRERITVFHNTLLRNNHGISGGDNLIALNNIFVGHFLALKNVDADSVASHNLFWQNTTNASGSVVAASIVADPLLDADYRLKASSPAIDAGVAHFEWKGETVMDQAAGSYQGSAPDLGWKETSSLSTVNDPPAITSNGGGATASKSVPENQTSATDVNAIDPNGDPLTYSISGGTDASAFKVDANSGVLTFATARDYEAPGDSNGDNVYLVTVTVSDGRGGSDSQQISVTVTDVDETSPPPISSAFDFSLRDAATVGGLAVANEDIVSYDGAGHFSQAFDGSDVRLSAFRIDAFSWLDSDTLLLSVDAERTDILPGMTVAVDDSDIVRFDATSLGATTAGTFSMYFDGSDVGLTTTAADVDAIELLPAGKIAVSTTDSVSLSGVSARDEDLLAFTPIALGSNTSGTFALHFDGSDVGLGESGEDIDGAAVDGSGNLYLSTRAAFAVPGFSGADEDVFVFDPTSLGPTTAGTYSSTLFFDGSSFGLAATNVYALDFPAP